MQNNETNLVAEEVQATETTLSEPVVEVTDAATVTEAPPVTQAPTQPPEVTQPPTTPPTEAPTATVAVSPTPTATQQAIQPDDGVSPLLIAGAVALILAVIAALVVVMLKGRKKPVHASAPASAPGTETIGEEAVTQSVGPITYTGPKLMAGMAQTVGARKNQQDSLYCSDWRNPEALATRGLLAAVADGIGGLADGNLASGAAMMGMRARFLGGSSLGSMSDRLLELAAVAQQEVLSVNASRTARSGSTLVTVLIQDGHMVFLSIGDSRICLYRSGALLQLNREHVLGRINREKQAFGHAVDPTKKPEALTAYLGQEGLQLIDRSLSPMRLVPGDKIVLMSDGVFGTISDAELIACLRNEPQQAADAIIDAVEKHQKPHQDNATVLVVGIG